MNMDGNEIKIRIESKAAVIDCETQLSLASANRIYFGSETCERSIPDEKVVCDIYRKTREMGLEFSLLTPPCTDPFLGKIKKLLSSLREQRFSGEIIVNDIGVLNCVNDFGFEPVIGRLLMPVFRDPRFYEPTDDLVHRYGVGFNRHTLIFFNEKFGVTRFEIQPTSGPLDLSDFQSMGFSFSIYSPLSIISRTRLCPTEAYSRFASKSTSAGRDLYVCSKTCRDTMFLLNDAAPPHKVMIIGNAIYYENPLNIESVTGLTSIRLVENGIGKTEILKNIREKVPL